MPSGASAARLVHTIAPVYDARSRVLLLGTFPSPKSRASGFFYGHPQNRFWRVMAAVLDVPAPRSNEEKAALMLSAVGRAAIVRDYRRKRRVD